MHDHAIPAFINFGLSSASKNFLTATLCNVISCSVTMRNTQQPALGELEHLLLSLLWQLGPSTADALRQALVPKRALKDSTIRTVLRRLEEKGFLTHSVDGRTFIYAAAAEPQRIAARAVQRIVDRFCGGSLEQLLVGMVENEVVGQNELERLARKIAEAKASRKTRTAGGR